LIVEKPIPFSDYIARSVNPLWQFPFTDFLVPRYCTLF